MYKQKILLLFASLLIGVQSLSAYSLWDFHPLHVGGNVLSVGKANCHHQRPGHTSHSGNVHFSKTNAYVTMLVPINEKNYFFPRVEYNYVRLDWNKNPKFNQNHFSYMQLGLMFYSIGLERWKWIARFDYNLQIEHISHPGLYSLYNGLLWGAYELHRKWHYHIGAVGYGGLEGFNIYPIIGFDFAPNKKWFFEAVFPITYSIAYNISSKWTLALKGRPLKERLRAGSREPQPRSVFSYSTMGAELNGKYELKRRLVVEGFVGYSFGGSFYVKNQSGHKAVYVNLDSAPYGGATLDWGF